MRINFFIFIFIFSLSKTSFGYLGAHSVLLEGTIESGVLYSKSDTPSKSLIKNQLKFLVGQLNEYGHGVEFTRGVIKNVQVHGKNPRTNLYKITYKATYLISWNIDQQIQNLIKVYVPLQGSKTFRDFYVRSFGELCRKDKIPSPMSRLNFWYRIRLDKEKCPLKTVSSQEVIVLDLKLENSSQNTKESSPQYSSIWKDNVLKSVLVFGKSKEDGLDHDSDAGIRSYNRMFEYTKRYFKLIESTAPSGLDRPGIKYPYIKSIYELSNGRRLEIHQFLTSEIKKETSEFKKLYNKVTYDADLISYNGHAGLGGNIDVFNNLGTTMPNHYQIIFANGCSTFSYFKDYAGDRHQRVNNQDWQKTLDIITNATPSYFSWNHKNNLRLINQLIIEENIWLSVLQVLDPRQQAVLFGEE